ncbi:MAG: hypothetical protein ACI8PZ_004526 [Myxococcota bacterium]|jgi:hypothetical protein
MSHTWRFQRAGGFDQVVVDSAADLSNLRHLDQKLWVALACPVVGTHLDAATLALIDGDDDGQIRAPELLAAIAWSEGAFTDIGALIDPSAGLPLSIIAKADVLGSAKRVLAGLSRKDAPEITVADTAGANAMLSAMPFNGDGVVPAASAEDPEVRAVIENILNTLGGTPDRSGAPGVGMDQVAAFWTALAEYDAWVTRADLAEDEVVPLGADTAAAVKVFADVKAKVEDFFTRCDLAAFDRRAAAQLGGDAGNWSAIGERTLSPTDAEIAKYPLAPIGPGQSLPLADGLNPAWAAAMAAFSLRVVTPLIGARDALDRAGWDDLKRRFSAYEKWLASKAGGVVEPLGIDRVRALVASDTRAAIEALIAEDLAVKPQADALLAVERAARYHRDLHALVRNFVNFRDFYDPGSHASFQAGVLYLDGRSCDLVMQVADVGKHSATATQSYAYLAYCTCERKVSGQTMSIVAAFTDGDSDFLAVGRNGLFYDRAGNDWSASIVKVVEQPISIRQAFWAPYKRLVRFISDQAESFAASQDKAASANLTAKATGTLDAAKTASAPGATPTAPTTASTAFDIGKFAGIFAALGLALGFMVSALTMVVTGFLGLRLWQMPLALLGVMLLISGPSMLLAAFKLRLRNLAPLLDANGWAINARARINIPFGRSLTQVATLPEGAKRDLKDPYRDSRSRLWLWILLVILISGVALGWDLGLKELLMEQLTPPEAPAAPAPAPAPPAPAPAP